MKPTTNNGFTIEEPQNQHVIQASVTQTDNEYWEEYWDNQLTYSEHITTYSAYAATPRYTTANWFLDDM